MDYQYQIPNVTCIVMKFSEINQFEINLLKKNT